MHKKIVNTSKKQTNQAWWIRQTQIATELLTIFQAQNRAGSLTWVVWKDHQILDSILWAALQKTIGLRVKTISEGILKGNCFPYPLDFPKYKRWKKATFYFLNPRIDIQGCQRVVCPLLDGFTFALRNLSPLAISSGKKHTEPQSLFGKKLRCLKLPLSYSTCNPSW